MIDLKKLQVFLQVAQGMNFSDAADHLHLSQPTVSHHIKTLERDLGIQLFERSASGLRLTEAGWLLLPRARKLLREASEVRQVMDALEDKIVGQIRIACSTTTGKYITPQFAARFCTRHPDVRISVLSCLGSSVVQSLLSEEAELGVVSYEVCGEGMECQEFFNDHIVLIVPAQHPWAARASVDPSELLETPVIIREPTSGTCRAMLTGLAEYDIVLSDLDVFLEVGNSEAIVKAVEAGYGVSFVSRLAAAWALDRGSVVEVPVVGFDLRRNVYLIRPERQVTNRAIDAYWGFVHDPSNADLLRIAEN